MNRIFYAARLHGDFGNGGDVESEISLLKSSPRCPGFSASLPGGNM